MNSTPILIQPDIASLSPTVNLDLLCIGGAIAYYRSWENEARGDQSGRSATPTILYEYREASKATGQSPCTARQPDVALKGWIKDDLSFARRSNDHSRHRPDMNHHHRKTLHALFAHPLSANVDLKKVVHLLEDLGAEVDNKPGNRVGVMLNGRSAAFTHAHRDLPKEEVVRVRKYLETCGVTPAKFPL